MVKNACLSVVLVLSAVVLSQAFAATLVWDANTDVVDGYRIHYGTSASNLSKSVNVGKATQYNLDQLPLTEKIQYYFSVSAYNSAGESDLSSPVAYTPADTTPPAPPKGLTAE
ncbi:MAG: fibronectin type III domain-containing protein [Desulfobacterales bacterium]